MENLDPNPYQQQTYMNQTAGTGFSGQPGANNISGANGIIFQVD